MIVSAQHLQESLTTKSFGPIGFGHGQLKYSAEIAASLYGCEWAYKNPSSLESIKLRRRLRDMVMASTPPRGYKVTMCPQAVRARATNKINKRISVSFELIFTLYDSLITEA